MLLPDPLRNGYYTHHLRWSLSMGEEHPLTLGAVVARAQVVLGGVAVDLVVDAAILATLCDCTTWIHDAMNSSAPGWQGCLPRY